MKCSVAACVVDGFLDSRYATCTMTQSVWPYDHFSGGSSDKHLGELWCFVICPSRPKEYWDELFGLIKSVCEQIGKGMGVTIRCAVLWMCLALELSIRRFGRTLDQLTSSSPTFQATTEIVAHECGEVVISVDQQQSNREDHVAGCFVKLTNTSVIELLAPREPPGPAYDDWVRREAVLWAHEICHLLGIHDLKRNLRTLLPPTRPGVSGYLMMGPYNPLAYQLLPLEGEVIMAYPNNDSEVGRLDQFLKDLTPVGAGNNR